MGMISSRQPRLSFTKVMGKQSRRSCGKAKRIVVPRRRSVPVGVAFPGFLHFVDVRHRIFIAEFARKPGKNRRFAILGRTLTRKLKCEQRALSVVFPFTMQI